MKKRKDKKGLFICRKSIEFRFDFCLNYLLRSIHIYIRRAFKKFGTKFILCITVVKYMKKVYIKLSPKMLY